MRKALLLTAGLFASVPTFAQDRDDQEIVVTGTGLAESRGDAVYDVVTIPRERLDRSASHRLEDILRDVPGFQNFRRSDARSAHPTSQGATLRALGGNASSRALLVLDGVPQTDPFGGWIYWPAYDPRRLAMARVFRGGGSGVNGPGALAGTIELTSAGPGDLDGLDAELSYGSRDSLDAFAGLGARVGEAYLLGTGSYSRGDGFVPVVEEQRGPVDRSARYEQANVALRGITPLSGTIEAQASALWFRDERERGVPFTDNLTEGLDASLRLVGRGAWQWSALGYVQERDYRNSFASVDAVRANAALAADQYDVPASGYGARLEVRPPSGDALELRLGADWRAVSGKTKEHANFVGGVPLRGRIAGGESETLGAFAEGTWQSAPLTLTAGGRLDRWWIADGFRIEQDLATGTDAPELHPDRSGWEPTGRAGVAWQTSEAVTLRSAAYLGWRLPTLNELYRPFRVGPDATAANAGLEPERLKGVEAGLEVRPNPNLRLGATLFANRLDNAIANVTLAQGPGVFPGVGFVSAAGSYSQRRNLDAVVARGIELEGRADFGRWFVGGGLSLVDAEVRAEGAAAPLDERRPAQTPKASASVSLGWDDRDGKWVSLSARYVGKQYEDDLESAELDDALTLDAAAQLPIGAGVSVQARAENFGNARVEAGISGAGIVERATPRTFWIGLRLAR